MQEMSDPALSLNRARETWRKHGRSEKWIQLRMTGQETRNKLTDYWENHNIKQGDEFAILTNLIHQEWADAGKGGAKSIEEAMTLLIRPEFIASSQSVRVLPIIPPVTQLNTPYPSTAYPEPADVAARRFAGFSGAVPEPKHHVDQVPVLPAAVRVVDAYQPGR